MEEKKYKTGDIIKIDKEKMEIIETFTNEKERLEIMFAVISKKYQIAARRFWDTLRDLYPGIKSFDLYANWGKKEITLRHKIEENDES